MGRYDALYQSSPPPAPTDPATPAQSVAVPVKPEPVQPQPIPEASTVREDRADEPNDRTDAASASLLDEITEGAPVERRRTERYSFEIYTDQKPRIEEVQYRFKQRTGKKLSSSRIIREAIEAYLPEALRLMVDRPTGTTPDRTERANRTGERSHR